VNAYRCIVADPPWHESGGGRIKRGADRHYPLLRTAEIAPVMLAAPCWRPAADCHLWLWTTNNRLASGEARTVAEALGFRPVTLLTWAKDRMGLGQYLRGQTEHALFCVRGRLPALCRTEPTILYAPRHAHSEKPQAFFDVAERVSPGPRLEMFARRTRPGWDSWGNEV